MLHICISLFQVSTLNRFNIKTYLSMRGTLDLAVKWYVICIFCYSHFVLVLGFGFLNILASNFTDKTLIVEMRISRCKIGIVNVYCKYLSWYFIFYFVGYISGHLLSIFSYSIFFFFCSAHCVNITTRAVMRSLS